MEIMIMDLEKERKDQLQIIKKFAASLTDKNTVDEIIWDVANNVISKLGFIDCVIYLIDPEQEVLVQKAAYGPKSPGPFMIKDPIKLALGKGIVGRVAVSGKSQIVDDVSLDPDYVVDDERRSSEISVPILVQGQVIGVIDSEHPEKGFFKEEHLLLLETIATIIGSKVLMLRAYDTLKIQTRDLQIINSQYKQSAFVISHDIKSPLANIKGLIDIYRLNQKNGDHEENDQVIMLIESSVKKLTSKIDDLNKVIEARNEPSKTAEIINFSRFIHNIKMVISLEIRNKNAIIKEDFSKAENIKYPPSYLESIILNLLTNAIKYKARDRNPVIELKTEKISGYTVLVVKDNGIGIDLKKHGDKLFRLFQRFHRKVEGKGLGLNLVKSQVESLGGRIEVDSEVGKGTVFKVYLKDLGE